MRALTVVDKVIRHKHNINGGMKFTALLFMTAAVGVIVVNQMD